MDGIGNALIAALSSNLEERQRGESYLNEASQSSAFCEALLAASSPLSGLPDAARLLGATTLKNEAVRHWRRGARREGKSSLRGLITLIAT